MAQVQAVYEPGPGTLLVLVSEPPSAWLIAMVGAVAVAIGWPWSLYAMPFGMMFGLLWLGALRWRKLDQPSIFAIERDRLVLVHHGLRIAPRRTPIRFDDIEVVWDLDSRILVELRDRRTCAIAFGAQSRRDHRPHAIYRVVENRTGLELEEHEPDAIRPWVEAVLQVFAEQGVVTREFPRNWKVHFWGGIARRKRDPST